MQAVRALLTSTAFGGPIVLTYWRSLAAAGKPSMTGKPLRTVDSRALFRQVADAQMTTRDYLNRQNILAQGYKAEGCRLEIERHSLCDFAGKLLSALRYQFGGHREKAASGKGSA
jgi:hypothetical protein